MRTPLRCDRLTLRVVLLISKCMVKKQQMQWTSLRRTSNWTYSSPPDSLSLTPTFKRSGLLYHVNTGRSQLSCSASSGLLK